MSEELKEAMVDLATGVKTLTDAVQEAKAQFDSATPGDVQEKLVRIAEDVTALSATVKRIDEAPALKRAFDVEAINASHKTNWERKMQLPSTASENSDMEEVFELQDTVEILRILSKA